MKAVSVWNPKGGEGKSTIAVNLAASAVKLGLKVLLVSRDIQDSEDSMSNYSNGKFAFDTVGKIDSSLEVDHDLMIIDYPAGYREKPQTHTVICPIVPCRMNYQKYLNAKNVLEGHKVIEVCNRGDMRRKQEAEFTMIMRRNGASVVTNRVVYSTAHNDQKTIYDPEYDKTSKITESRFQIEAILARVLSDE